MNHIKIKFSADTHKYACVVTDFLFGLFTHVYLTTSDAFLGLIVHLKAAKHPRENKVEYEDEEGAERRFKQPLTFLKMGATEAQK